MAEKRCETVHLRDLLEFCARMGVEPCEAQEHGLAHAEGSVVDALIHAAVAVEGLGLVLNHIAGEVKPFGDRLYSFLYLCLHARKLVAE